MVFENGSVEIQDFESVYHHRPTRLMLFTPHGIEYLPELFNRTVIQNSD